MYSLVSLLALAGTITLFLTDSVIAMILVVAAIVLVSIICSILISHIRWRLRKDLLFKLFSIIKIKSGAHQQAKEEADCVIKILYENNEEAASPIYIFVNESLEIDLLVLALLRAALRHLGEKIEIEMHGQGYLKMDKADRKRFDFALQKMRSLEKNIDFANIPLIKKIDILVMESIGATRIHYQLLKMNGKNIPEFEPLFFIVQKTSKYPRRILFPLCYE